MFRSASGKKSEENLLLAPEVRVTEVWIEFIPRALALNLVLTIEPPQEP